MPLVQVTVRQGRSPEHIHRLIGALTDAVVTALDAPRESVRVIINEVPPTHWANGGVTLQEKYAASTGAAPSAGADVGD
jgi:4-oxalocrotonate tautomerase